MEMNLLGLLTGRTVAMEYVLIQTLAHVLRQSGDPENTVNLLRDSFEKTMRTGDLPLPESNQAAFDAGDRIYTMALAYARE